MRWERHLAGRVANQLMMTEVYPHPPDFLIAPYYSTENSGVGQRKLFPSYLKEKVASGTLVTHKSACAIPPFPLKNSLNMQGLASYRRCSIKLTRISTVL